MFTHPLFRTTADLIPEMQTYARACDTNRAIWQARLEQLEADADANERRTAALRDLVCAPVSLAQNERFHSLFPLILPPRLTADAPGSAGATPTAAASATATAATPSWATPRSPPQSPARAPASPAVQAVRVVYRDEVHDRSMIARHVLALTGFDPAMGVRRMSTPEVLLVHSRS